MLASKRVVDDEAEKIDECAHVVSLASKQPSRQTLAKLEPISRT